jgi:hypothetical protein
MEGVVEIAEFGNPRKIVLALLAVLLGVPR